MPGLLVRTILLLCSVVWWDVASAKVIPLTEPLFDALTQAGKADAKEAWFVKFYAPWCGHCKRLVPTWEQLGEDINHEGFRVGKVDATVDNELANRFLVSRYPTLLMFHKGDMIEYKGPRDLQSLQRFVQSVLDEDPGVKRNQVPPPRVPPTFLDKFLSLPPLYAVLSVVTGGVFGAGIVFFVFRPRTSDEAFQREVDQVLKELDEKRARLEKEEREKGTSEKESKKDR